MEKEMEKKMLVTLLEDGIEFDIKNLTADNMIDIIVKATEILMESLNLDPQDTSEVIEFYAKLSMAHVGLSKLNKLTIEDILNMKMGK